MSIICLNNLDGRKSLNYERFIFELVRHFTNYDNKT